MMYIIKKEMLWMDGCWELGGGLTGERGKGAWAGWYVRWGCEVFGGTMFGGVEWDS